MFLLNGCSSHILTFSPTSCALISHLIFDKTLPLIINKPRTALPRLIIYNSRAIKSIRNIDFAHAVEYADDLFDDLLDVISSFHLCNYNLCTIIYTFIFVFIIMRYLHFQQLHKRNS